MRQGARRAAVAITSITAVAALTLAGCTPSEPGSPTGQPTGGTGNTNGQITDAEREKALTTPTDLTFWTWVPDIQEQVDLFEKQYPAIHVKVENVGQGLDHYAKVRTASKAGSGGPDVVQLEYQFISSFAQTGDLLDLTPYGAADIAGDYVPWVWKQVLSNDQVVAIPQDSGPMGNLYRDDIMTGGGCHGAAGNVGGLQDRRGEGAREHGLLHLQHGAWPGGRVARAVVAGRRQAVRL